jgi:hypothetical protein
VIKALSEMNRRGFPIGIMLEIYHSMFSPLVSYAIPIWGGLSECGLKRLQILQNRAIRAMLGLTDRISVRDKLSELGVLSILKLYKYKTLIMGYRFANDLFPQNFSTKISKNLNNKSRKKIPLITPLTKFTITQRSFNYRLIEEWNNCDQRV